MERCIKRGDTIKVGFGGNIVNLVLTRSVEGGERSS